MKYPLLQYFNQTAKSQVVSFFISSVLSSGYLIFKGKLFIVGKASFFPDLS